MKTSKIITVLLVLSMIICLVSCDYDPYEGKRPIDQPGTTWVCEKYQMKFTVGEFESSEFVTKNGTFHFQLLFGMYDNSVIVHEYNNYDNQFFNGDCEFSSKRFVINVDQDIFSEVYFDEFPVVLEFEKVE